MKFHGGRITFAVGLTVTLTALGSACGSSTATSSNTTTTTTPTTVATTTTTTVAATTSTTANDVNNQPSSGPTSTTTPPTSAPSTSTAKSALPVGPAHSFIFGSVKDEGTPISLVPQNTADVNQAAVKAAPKVGPFRISMAAGPRSWPNVCEFSSQAQLKALFPAIIKLKRAVGTKAELLGSGGNTPRNTQCQYNLKTTFDPAGYTTPTYVEVSLEEVDSGAPSIWKQEQQDQAKSAKKYPAQYAYYPDLLNGVKCFYDGTELQCLKGNIDYWVGGIKVTGGEKTDVDNAVWIDQMEIPLAEVLGTELSTTP